MKTIKLLAIVFILMGFASKAVNGQAGKMTVEICVNFYCMNEDACGYVTYHWSKDAINSFWDGKLIGTKTGTVYLVKNGAIFHRNYNENNDAFNRNLVGYMMIHADGKLIAKLRYQYHITINANGEITADFGHENAECLDD